MRIRSLVELAALAAGLSALVAAVAPGGSPAAEEKPKADEAAWTPLFNGKDLDGWKATGDAAFKVEDGCIVGAPKNAKGGDLYTEKEWDNFELRFTYKAVWPANSGVWFRTKYQFDILKWKDPVAFSGSLYCPGKMFVTKNLDEGIENRDGWNLGRVCADGDRIVLWLNGRKVGECNDKTFDKGKVGIQVHGGDEFKNMKIFFKKIEIRPLKMGEKPTEPAPPKTDAK